MNAGADARVGRAPALRKQLAEAVLPASGRTPEDLAMAAAATARGRPVTELRRSRADDVYDQIQRDVAAFRLVPGDRFSENDLCARTGVSRTPVRQALYRLQQEGLVEVSFRSGWRVLPFDFDQFDEMYELRTVLESSAAQRLCAGGSRVDGNALKALEAIWLVPPAERSVDATTVARWDEEFHCALVDAAGNAHMARVHRDLTERIRVIRRLDFTQKPRIQATYDEHGKILLALRRGRADQAVLLLSSHIATSQAEVRKITLHQIHLAKVAARGT